MIFRPEWVRVNRDQCRPDLLCICCDQPMGEPHAVLCYAMANERRAVELGRA